MFQKTFLTLVVVSTLVAANGIVRAQDQVEIDVAEATLVAAPETNGDATQVAPCETSSCSTAICNPCDSVCVSCDPICCSPCDNYCGYKKHCGWKKGCYFRKAWRYQNETSYCGDFCDPVCNPCPTPCAPVCNPCPTPCAPVCNPCPTPCDPVCNPCPTPCAPVCNPCPTPCAPVCSPCSIPCGYSNWDSCGSCCWTSKKCCGLGKHHWKKAARRAARFNYNSFGGYGF